jgi:hypothetical protein
MVDFVTNKLRQETRLSIDDRNLKLYPASDGMMHNEDNIQLDAVIAATIQIDEFVDFPFSIHLRPVKTTFGQLLAQQLRFRQSLPVSP